MERLVVGRLTLLVLLGDEGGVEKLSDGFDGVGHGCGSDVGELD